MDKVLKYNKFILDIEKSLGIKLLQYEKEYLNALLIADKYDKKIIINKARRNSHSFSRVDLIFILIMETRKKLDEFVLYGNVASKTSGIIDELKEKKMITIKTIENNDDLLCDIKHIYIRDNNKTEK